MTPLAKPAVAEADGLPREDWFRAASCAATAYPEAAIAEVCEAYKAECGLERLRPEPRRMIAAVVCALWRVRLAGVERLRIHKDHAYYDDPKRSGYRHPEVETTSFPDVLAYLVKAQWVALIELGSRAAGRVSRIGVGPRLVALMTRHPEAAPTDFKLDPEGPVIVVQRPGSEADEGDKRLPYTMTDEVRREEKRIRADNKWTATFDIQIRMDGWEGGAPPPTWADPSERFIYRIFHHTPVRGTDPTLIRPDRYGRLHGAFYIGMPSEERWRIRLNGEGLVQLDFSSMFPSLLYAREGLPVPPGDMHSVPEVEAVYAGRGLSPEAARRAARKVVKLFSNARLFDTSARRSYPQDDDGEPLPPDFWPDNKREMSPRTMANLIAQRHPRIAHYFGSGVGHELFIEESNIILTAREMLREHSIPALSIHDALLVRLSDYGAAGHLMAQAFLDHAMIWPAIKAERLADPWQAAHLRFCGVEDLVELRSVDGLSVPQWSRPKLTIGIPSDTLIEDDVPDYYRNRGDRAPLWRAIVENYKHSREALLGVLSADVRLYGRLSADGEVVELRPAVFESRTLHGELMLALAVTEKCLRDFYFDEEKLIGEVVKRCAQRIVFSSGVADLRDLAASLKQAGWVKRDMDFRM